MRYIEHDLNYEKYTTAGRRELTNLFVLYSGVEWLSDGYRAVFQKMLHRKNYKINNIDLKSSTLLTARCNPLRFMLFGSWNAIHPHGCWSAEVVLL